MTLFLIFITITLFIGCLLLLFLLKRNPKNIKQVLIAIGAILVFLAFIFNIWLNMDSILPLNTIENTEVQGKVLVVAHYDPWNYHTAVLEQYIEGLINEGWHVDIVSAGVNYSWELEGYDVLVLSGPEIFGTACRPLTRYLREVGDLEGMQVVTLTTGFWFTQHVSDMLTHAVVNSNGVLLQELIIFQSQPMNVALENAHNFGESLKLK